MTRLSFSKETLDDDRRRLSRRDVACDVGGVEGADISEYVVLESACASSSISLSLRVSISPLHGGSLCRSATEGMVGRVVVVGSFCATPMCKFKWFESYSDRSSQYRMHLVFATASGKVCTAATLSSGTAHWADGFGVETTLSRQLPPFFTQRHGWENIMIFLGRDVMSKVCSRASKVTLARRVKSCTAPF